VAGGKSKSLLVVTLDECLRICTDIPACSGIDWVPYESVGSRCWFHGTWSMQHSLVSYGGVQHWDIERPAYSVGK